MRKLKQSTARNILLFMTDSADHITGKTGLTLTITASKAAAAFASISPTVTERTNGWYQIALTSSHTDTLGDFALHVTASGADALDVLMQVVAYDEGAADIGITQFSHETGLILLGLFRRLEAVLSGEAEGLNSSVATYKRPDGSIAIQATQNPAQGTREDASTRGGD